MKLLQKPPRIKVLEAAGSLGDGRVRMVGADEALVTSSTGEREYHVKVVIENDSVIRAYSDDNGTLHRSYVGYPILAVLMMKGVLPVDNDVVKAMRGVPWKELNERYGRYSVVEGIVVNRAEKMGVSRSVIDDYVNLIMKKLGLLKIYFDEDLAPKPPRPARPSRSSP